MEIKEDLLEALKELLTASEALGSCEIQTSEECARYVDATDRARQVITRAQR
jgi:hypothetical protein